LHFLQTVLVEGFDVPQEGHLTGLTAVGGRKHIVISPLCNDFYFNANKTIFSRSIFFAKSVTSPKDIHPAWQCFTQLGTLPFSTLSWQ
jgi:hypothetical protein